MTGLEGAPGAVESHLHRGEGQIGHEILTTLRIAVLHLEQRAKVGNLSYPKVNTGKDQSKHKGQENRSIPGFQWDTVLCFWKWLA